jgi:hypothetical protein
MEFAMFRIAVSDRYLFPGLKRYLRFGGIGLGQSSGHKYQLIVLYSSVEDLKSYSHYEKSQADKPFRTTCSIII